MIKHVVVLNESHKELYLVAVCKDFKEAYGEMIQFLEDSNDLRDTPYTLKKFELEGEQGIGYSVNWEDDDGRKFKELYLLMVEEV